MPQFIFFDKNQDIVDEFQRHLGGYGNVKCVKGEIQTILRNYKIDAVVSPANSFGEMDGGIDRVYMILFDAIEHTVKQYILRNGRLTKSGKKYMPVGSAFTVPVKTLPNHPKLCNYVISAPTMFYPQDIRGTLNVYFSFLGILHATQNLDITIGVPGLGTGVGGISASECAAEIARATKEFSDGISTNRYPKGISFSKGNGYFITSHIPCPQRDLYFNKDIPEID